MKKRRNVFLQERFLYNCNRVSFIKSWETDKTKSEKLEKAKAELEALKNQIDPHFMFNSLNTLSYLIEKQPAKAKLFNDNLAEVFRYILYNKERNLVLLSEELAFAEKYFSLVKIRFGSGVALRLLPNNAESDNYLIPPISLQVLLVDRERRRYIVDKKLSDLEAELDGKQFFRVNRKFLANINAVVKFKPYEKERLIVELYPAAQEEIVVSQERAALFKQWMGK